MFIYPSNEVNETKKSCSSPISDKVNELSNNSCLFSAVKFDNSSYHLMYTSHLMLEQYTFFLPHLGDFIVPALECICILKNTIYFLGNLLFLPLSLLGGFKSFAMGLLSIGITLGTILINVATLALSIVSIATRNLISLLHGYSGYTNDEKRIEIKDDNRLAMLEVGMGFLCCSDISEEMNIDDDDNEGVCFEYVQGLINPGSL